MRSKMVIRILLNDNRLSLIICLSIDFKLIQTTKIQNYFNLKE